MHLLDENSGMIRALNGEMHFRIGSPEWTRKFLPQFTFSISALLPYQCTNTSIGRSTIDRAYQFFFAHEQNNNWLVSATCCLVPSASDCKAVLAHCEVCTSFQRVIAVHCAAQQVAPINLYHSTELIAENIK